MNAHTDRANPWPGIYSYTPADRELFFGREEETEELLRLVHDEPLATLYSASGLGKTSLLGAGLIPRLANIDCVPCWLRFSPAAASGPPSGENTGNASFATANEAVLPQASAGFGSAAELVERCRAQANAQLIQPPAGEARTLWEYFHRRDHYFWSRRYRLQTPVLILDQFEEIFTLGQRDAETRERTRELLRQLADLVYNRPPDVVRTDLAAGRLDPDAFTFEPVPLRVVLAFREDFLPQFNELKREGFPTLGEAFLRLLPFQPTAARRCIEQPAPDLLEPGVAEELVTFLSGARSGESQGRAAFASRNFDFKRGPSIDPTLLSVVCRRLNDERLKRGLDRIASGHFGLPLNRIIDDFYDGAFEGVAPELRRYVENDLVSPSGYRDNRFEEDALARPGIDSAGIGRLVEGRLLRRLEGAGGRPRLELAHDLLCGAAHRARGRRELTQALHQLEAKLRSFGWGLVGAVLAVLVLWVSAEGSRVRWQRGLPETYGPTGSATVRKTNSSRVSWMGPIPDMVERLRHPVEPFDRWLRVSLNSETVSLLAGGTNKSAWKTNGFKNQLLQDFNNRFSTVATAGDSKAETLAWAGSERLDSRERDAKLQFAYFALQQQYRQGVIEHGKWAAKQTLFFAASLLGTLFVARRLRARLLLDLGNLAVRLERQGELPTALAQPIPPAPWWLAPLPSRDAVRAGARELRTHFGRQHRAVWAAAGMAFLTACGAAAVLRIFQLADITYPMARAVATKPVTLALWYAFLGFCAAASVVQIVAWWRERQVPELSPRGVLTTGLSRREALAGLGLAGVGALFTGVRAIPGLGERRPRFRARKQVRSVQEPKLAAGRFRQNPRSKVVHGVVGARQGSPVFVAADFPDPTALARRIVSQQDPVSVWLFKTISADGRTQIRTALESTSTSASELAEDLATQMNAVLRGPLLVDSSLFPAAKSPPRPKHRKYFSREIEKEKQEKKEARLSWWTRLINSRRAAAAPVVKLQQRMQRNRRLLAGAYPGLIVRERMVPVVHSNPLRPNDTAMPEVRDPEVPLTLPPNPPRKRHGLEGISHVQMHRSACAFEQAALRCIAAKEIDQACRFLLAGVRYDQLLPTRSSRPNASFHLVDLLAGLAVRHQKPTLLNELAALLDQASRPSTPIQMQRFRSRVERWSNPASRWHRRWSNLGKPLFWSRLPM